MDGLLALARLREAGRKRGATMGGVPVLGSPCATVMSTAVDVEKRVHDLITRCCIHC